MTWNLSVEKPRGAGKSEILASSQRLVLADQLDQVRSTVIEQTCSLSLEDFQLVAGICVMQGWTPGQRKMKLGFWSWPPHNRYFSVKTVWFLLLCIITSHTGLWQGPFMDFILGSKYILEFLGIPCGRKAQVIGSSVEDVIWTLCLGPWPPYQYNIYPSQYNWALTVETQICDIQYTSSG